jgi:hypothetical protein
MYSKFAHWAYFNHIMEYIQNVLWAYVDYLLPMLTMCSPCTHWVFGPSPPVRAHLKWVHRVGPRIRTVSIVSPGNCIYSDQTTCYRIFYQHDSSRLLTCLFSIYTLLHIADRIESAGPVWCYWVFVMEWFCSAVGQHVKN